MSKGKMGLNTPKWIFNIMDSNFIAIYCLQILDNRKQQQVYCSKLCIGSWDALSSWAAPMGLRILEIIKLVRHGTLTLWSGDVVDKNLLAKHSVCAALMGWEGLTDNHYAHYCHIFFSTLSLVFFIFLLKDFTL
jgi:hypothetical protein